MPNEEYQKRIADLERNLRNMKMAVIVIVAFFLYEALMPSELRPAREKIHDVVKTKELVLVNDAGDVFARLGVAGEGERRGQLVLNDDVGNRAHLDAGAARLLVRDGADVVEQLSIMAEGIEIYNRSGERVGHLP